MITNYVNSPNTEIFSIYTLRQRDNVFFMKDTVTTVTTSFTQGLFLVSRLIINSLVM